MCLSCPSREGGGGGMKHYFFPQNYFPHYTVKEVMTLDNSNFKKSILNWEKASLVESCYYPEKVTKL